MSISQLTPCEREWKMWLWVTSALFLVHIVSPKPAVEDETARRSRQLDLEKCCPCPGKPGSSLRSQEHWFPQNGRNFVELTGNERSTSNGMGFFRSDFDDCPCRSRSADSEGSSSIFFPSSLRPGPHSKPQDSKEDPKNLLEPEVGLASSVLETLREATDEEYRDALARDAARNRAADDATPEESAQNIITIILPNANDDEDIISEPSHIQEARCIHPLGRSLGRMSTTVTKRPNLNPNFFRVPQSKPVGLLHRNGFDMDSGFGASNIQERIVESKGQNKKLNAKPILMKNSEFDVCDVGLKKGSNMKTVSLLEKGQETPQRTDALKGLNNLKTKMNMKSNEECNLNNVMKSAASDNKEIFKAISYPELKLSPLATENSPLNIKNLLQLRDVEFIPPSQLIEKLKLGQTAFQIPSLIENMPKLSDLLKNGIKLDINKNRKWTNAKNDDKSLEDGSSKTNIQVIPRDKTVTTEILDAMPSTSNINEMQDSCDIRKETLRTKPKTLSAIIPKKTEIIESIPNLFHQTENIDDVTNNDINQNVKSEEDDGGLTPEINKNDKDDFESSRNEQATSDLESQGDTQSRIISDVLGQDFDVSDCLEKTHDEETSAEDSDDILPKDVSSSDMKPFVTVNVEDKLKNDLNSNAQFISLLNNQKVSSLSQSLKSVKESILRKIEDGRKTSKLNEANKLRESSIEKNKDISDKVEQNCDTEPSENPLSLSSKILDTDDNKQIKSKALQLEDLQKLSDSLLQKSLLKEETPIDIEHNECDDGIESNTNGRSVHKLSSYNKDLTVDSDTASSNQHEMEIRNPSKFDLMPQSNECDDKDSTFVGSTDVENLSKPLKTGINVNEMDVEASEPVIGTSWQDPLQIFKDIHLGTPLFQNIVVEPSSLLEQLRNPQIPDLGAVLNLPSLDDIKERLANVFSRNDKDSSFEDIDCPNEKSIMSAEPSTSNFISRSPSLPLQDLNLDIFQLKPLSHGKSTTLSKIPGVNLKSFRTKVPVPNNLELKPLRLQSTVGNEGGLLGATLTLGRDSTGIPKILEALGNPSQNLPTLNEMMTKMRTNVESLVKSPLDFSRNIDPVPRIDDITNSLRSNTENTIRALQGRMGTTLERANNILSNSPGKPEDILERLVDAKEDMEAKLKGLHYDLNDRLTSIHENILDNTGLSSLNSLFEGNSLSRNAFNNNNHFNGLKNLKTPISKRLKADNKKETLGKAANLKNKSSSERKINSIASQRKFKMPAAASVPVPKTIEAPKLKSMLDRHLSSPENDAKLRFVSSRIKPLDSENSNYLPKLQSKHFPEKGVLGKHTSSFKEKKVKVTFGSTTPASVSNFKSQQRSKPDFTETPKENFVRRIGIQRNEPNGSPSEPLTTRLRSLKAAESRKCAEDVNSFEDSVDNGPFIKNSRNNEKAFGKQDNLKTPITPVPLRSENNRKSANTIPKLPIPSLPKIDDNSFLSKVREAVKARLSSFDPKAVVDREVKTCSDMERAASDKTNFVVEENLKENIPYKCKMVCTRS